MTRHRLSRRNVLAGLVAVPVSASSATAGRVLHLGADPRREVFIDMSQDGGVAEAHGIPAPRDLRVNPGLAADQIFVLQDSRVLRHVFRPGWVREYPVGLGKAGLEFSGEAVIQRKAEWPSWRPTDDMIARNPDQYAKYADGVPGGPRNPLGARALYLYRDGVDTYYRIHGTDAPATVGQYVSNGCIRMLNDHVIELYDRVRIGTTVRVIS